MKFKKILVLLIAISFGAYAQNGIKEKKDQIKALKMDFFNSELSLSANESDRFWPIYNTYDDKQFQIRHKKLKTYRNQMQDNILNKMSERDAAALLADIESTDEELYILKKRLIADLKTFLPKIKIIKLKKAEEDFNRKLLQQYKDKHDRK